MGSLELRKIHEGKRGEIHIITGDSLKDEEITIFITKRVSLSDSIVMEFGATPEEKKEKHPEFRKIVDEINKDAD